MTPAPKTRHAPFGVHLYHLALHFPWGNNVHNVGAWTADFSVIK